MATVVNAIVQVAIILVMVAFNALYVAAEFATVGSRRSRVQDAADQGSGPARRLLATLQDPKRLDNYVATCQIGITLSSLVAGAYGQAQLTPLLEPYFGDAGRGVAIVIVLVIITTLQVVLGELLPKTIALRYPERLAMSVVAPLRISQLVLRPLVAFFNGSAFKLMRAMGLHADHSHAHVHSPEELARLYRASAEGGLIEAEEREMLAGILNVEGRLVREIMTPRTRLVTVAGSATVGEALGTMASGRYTRFPVTDENGEIDGMVNLRDLYLEAATDPDRLVSDIAFQPVAVIETVAVPHLWQALRDEVRHAALVINEYGDVAGMVTLEDAVEEILGEIQDEFDDEVEPVVVADGRVFLRGDVLLSVVKDRLGVSLEADDVDTVGGWVWHRIGRLPVVGELVANDADPSEEDTVVLRVESMDGRAVTRVSFPFEGDER